MKLARSLLLASLLPVLGVLTVGPGCAAPASKTVAAVQTLKSVGEAAEAAIGLVADLYGAGKITAAQARAVADFYDTRFQPAFRVARAAVNADLSKFAPDDVLALSQQLTALVSQLQIRSP